MPIFRQTIAGLFMVLLYSACLYSEQSGQTFRFAPDGTGKELGNLSIHFRSTANYVWLFLRLSLFVALVWLTRRAFRAQVKQHRALLVALVIACGAAASFFAIGVPKVLSYQVDVDESRLAISIPFDTDVSLTWDQITFIKLSGTEISKLQYGTKRKLYEDWKTLEIVSVDGNNHVVDLSDLTVIQRSNLVKAISDRSKMKRMPLPGL